MTQEFGLQVATQMAPVLTAGATKGLATAVDGFVTACRIKSDTKVALARISAELNAELAQIHSRTELSLATINSMNNGIQSVIMNGKVGLSSEQRVQLIQTFVDSIIKVATR